MKFGKREKTKYWSFQKFEFLKLKKEEKRIIEVSKIENLGNLKKNQQP